MLHMFGTGELGYVVLFRRTGPMEGLGRFWDGSFRGVLDKGQNSMYYQIYSKKLARLVQ